MQKYPAQGKELWIVKPGENTNRGCGITVCRELEQIKSIIVNHEVNGKRRSYIIQKYCERPLLYKGRKFDIRLYTLVTSVNGNMQAYFYQEGYLRTSSREYTLKNVQNRLIHLTNDAVQARCAEYGKFE
jgi:tubulin monoglycylase TTLL3/8